MDLLEALELNQVTYLTRASARERSTSEWRKALTDTLVSLGVSREWAVNFVTTGQVTEPRSAAVTVRRVKRRNERKGNLYSCYIASRYRAVLCAEFGRLVWQWEMDYSNSHVGKNALANATAAAEEIARKGGYTFAVNVKHGHTCE